MRKTLIVAALALVSISGSAMAAGSTAQQPDAAKAACKAEKKGMGTLVFKQTYGVKSNAKAMAACIAKTEPVVAAEAKNAAKECKAERDADATLFNDTYGSNKNKKNAYGKCVSTKTDEAVEETTEARVNAAKTCKTMRSDDKAGFEATYGMKKNAFGKCVSATAKAQGDDEDAA